MPLLRELHWLRVPEGIQFRLCVLAYRCLTGTAPQYLADTLSLSTNVAARCRLRSADSRTLQLPSTRRTTLDDRTFSVAAARAWNSLLPEIRNSDSLLTFRRMTKTYLFQLSFANWTLLIGTLYFCNFVKCPISMYLAMCQYFCNNNKNNNNVRKPQVHKVAYSLIGWLGKYYSLTSYRLLYSTVMVLLQKFFL